MVETVLRKLGKAQSTRLIIYTTPGNVQLLVGWNLKKWLKIFPLMKFSPANGSIDHQFCDSTVIEQSDFPLAFNFSLCFRNSKSPISRWTFPEAYFRRL